MSDLTATAQRMLDTLPDYHHGNAITERIVQAWANRIDEMDARCDTIKVGLIPGAATDELGMLSLWEMTFDLPVRPVGITEAQRQAIIRGRLKRLDLVAASDLAVVVNDAIGVAWTLQRNTPMNLQDTITIPYHPGSYQAGQVIEALVALWPAHRELLVAYAGVGFVLDDSPLDFGTF